MGGKGWAKGAAVVLAAVGTVAMNSLDALAQGGLPARKAYIAMVVAGVVALAAFLSTDAGRAAVKAEGQP